jgi:hypothetical protein
MKNANLKQLQEATASLEELAAAHQTRGDTLWNLERHTAYG